MIELREGGVVLRAFGPEEIDVAMERMQSIPAADLDEEETRLRRERLEHSGERNDWELMFAVEADGRLVGDVQGRCLRFAMPPGVWELGIELWDGADRGRGAGNSGLHRVLRVPRPRHRGKPDSGVHHRDHQRGARCRTGPAL